MPTPFLPSDTMRVLLVDPDGVPYDIAGIIGMGEFFPSDTARVVLVDADGNPYKATGGGGSGPTIQVEGVNTSDQTLANFVAGANVTITNPSGGIIQIASTGGGGTGTVTQVDTANGITGGPITTTGTISGINAAADGSTKGVAAFTASDFNSASGVISIDYANGQKATSLQPGFLTAADWSTFNGKQAAGNYITALTSDVTASGPGSAAATIANNAVTTVKINNTAVTLAKIQNATANSKLLGSGAAGSGASYSELTLGTNLSMSGTTLNASGGGGATFFNPPGLRLTTVTGVPVPTTGALSGSGTLFYTPYLSGNIWYYDGAAWQVETIAEQSASVTGLTAAKIYDVFYLHGTGIVFSSAWTNDTTRADALGTQDGVTVLSSDHTKLWIGTIRVITITGTVNVVDYSGGVNTQEGGKRFCWNAFNQVRRPMVVIDTTDSWNYTTNAVREANGASTNLVEYVTGDAGSSLEAIVRGVVYIGSNSARAAKVGVGIDSVSAFSGLVQGGYNTDTTGAGGSPANLYAPVTGGYSGQPGLGRHQLVWLENGADGTCTFLGDNGGDGQQTGLQATVWA